MTETATTVTKSLYATVGAGDAIYAAFHDIVERVRQRAATADVPGRVEEARERIANLPADVQEQFESLRQRLSGLPSEFPDDLAELRERFTADELRRLADQYYRQALDFYSELASRGEETVERLRANPTFEERFEQVESFYNDLSHRAENVFDTLSGQVDGLLSRPVKEAEDTVDAEVVQVTSEPAPAGQGMVKKVPAKKTPAKKAPAKKTSTTKR